jgi:hypothetical protein
MKNLFIPLALLLALSVPALADDDNNRGNDGNNRGGAGLPVLLIGGGIYLMVGRKKGSSAD